MPFDVISYVLAKRKGLTWYDVKAKLEIEGALNKVYDVDLDGIIDSAKDADTVDGKHASDFAPATHSHVRADITDLLPIKRSDLEYPTSDVSFAYLAAINKTELFKAGYTNHIAVLISDVFTDKAITGWGRDRVRWQGRIDKTGNGYTFEIVSDLSTADFYIVRWVNGTATTIASESVDLADEGYLLKISISGSTLKWFRDDLVTPKIAATDTTHASGYFGVGHATTTTSRLPIGSYVSILEAPSTPLPPAKAIVEAEIISSDTGDGSPKANLKQELVEVSKLTNVPEFLKQEAKRYEILKNKGFTDEEIKALLGRTPRYRVDLASVTNEFFEFKPEHNTVLLAITKGNAYVGDDAILKQIEYAKSKSLITLKPPKDYREAVEQYKQLRRDFPEWIAGKDNYAYLVLGHKELDCFQVADTYHGRIVEMGDTKAYKGVSDKEMRKTLNMWIERLKKVNVLKEEAEKHLKKLEEVLRKGW